MNVTDLARPEIRELAPYASARSLAAGDGILLNANEIPWPSAGDRTLALNRYPQPQPGALKSRLAGYYCIEPERLLLTRGSDEGIDLLVRTFCRAGRDRVLICPPCFGMYEISARIQGADVIGVPLIESDEAFRVDFDGIRQAGACRLHFLCSPNNPTGNGIDAGRVTELADQVVDHGLVVVDEAYVEFSARRSLAATVADHPNLVVIRTLSKAFGLAGCRVGAVIADPAVIDLLGRVIAPYPLPTPSVAAALEALTDEALARQRERIAELMAHKRVLLEAFERHPAVTRIWPGEANFILVRTLPDSGLVETAAAAGIRLRDQSRQPGLAGCVRITVGTAEENAALIEFLEEWRP
ncbi:MAG: histidinol-phosphate transaminase [Wenzhouxiangella sp.]